jgi:hypothetical protein
VLSRTRGYSGHISVEVCRVSESCPEKISSEKMSAALTNRLDAKKPIKRLAFHYVRAVTFFPSVRVNPSCGKNFIARAKIPDVYLFSPLICEECPVTHFVTRIFSCLKKQGLQYRKPCIQSARILSDKFRRSLIPYITEYEAFMVL